MSKQHKTAAYNHRQAQKASTLMRKAVKKPKPSAKKSIKTQAELNKQSIRYIKGNPRLHKSSKKSSIKVSKSSKIKHFYINWDEVKKYEPEEYIPSQVIAPTKHKVASIAHQTDEKTSHLDKLLQKGLNNASAHLEPPMTITHQTNIWPYVLGAIVIILFLLIELHKI